MDADHPIDSGTGRFRIEAKLGEGGFGTVYLAFDHKRSSRIALKVLRQNDPDTLYRFKQEFRSLADVQHPNLVKLHELLAEGDRWFLTMEFVEGTSFVQYVTRSPHGSADLTTRSIHGIEDSSSNGLPTGATRAQPEPLRAALRQLAEGLAALHGARKLHRDVKPSNVLITPSGRVVILDFGLVAELNVLPDPMRSVAIAGTPAYMAPEVLAGQPATPASDWYSAGVMLYEALTGTHPFKITQADFVAGRVNRNPRPPAEIAAGIPSDLNSLCMDLLRNEPGQRPDGQEVLARLGTPVAGSQNHVDVATSSSTFVGRGAEMAALFDAFQSSSSGQAVIQLVRGASGIGKTALVRKFLSRLRVDNPGAVILAGRCYEQESVPYKGLDSLVDSLSRYLRSLREADQDALLPRDAFALARLFPVLGQAASVAKVRHRGSDPPDSLEMRRRAFTAFRELLGRLADRHPLVLFIDDLHWSDLDSARLISEVLRPPDAPAMMLIVTFRAEDTETSPALQTLLEWCRTTVGVEVRDVAVQELQHDEARDLVRQLLSRDHAEGANADLIVREAGGSPFFVQQLVMARDLRPLAADARKESDATLDDALRAQLDRLSESAQDISEVLAAAGRPVERAVLVRAARVQDHAEAIDSLRAAHLARARSTPDGELFELYHARIADSIRRQMGASSLSRRHGELAEAFEVCGRGDAETLFAHWNAAGNRAAAAEYAVKAAAQAWQALAFDRAARLYRAAIDLGALDREAIYSRLGDALMNAGRGEEAAEAYLKAAETASPIPRLELQRKAFEQLLRSGHINQGMDVMRTVLASLNMKLPETPRAALLSLVWRRLYLKLRGLGFRERDAGSLPPSDLLRVDACGSVALGLGIVDNIRGADFQVRHLMYALRAGEPNRIARALALEVAFSASVGTRRQRRTETLQRRTQELVDRLQSPHLRGMTMLTSGLAAYLFGEWRDAVKFMHEAEKIFTEQCTGVAQELDNVRNFLLRSYVWLGDFNVLYRRLPELLMNAEERGDLYAATMMAIRNSYIPLLAGDDPAAAHEATARALDRWPQKGFRTPHYIYLCVTTDIDLYAGDPLRAWNRISEAWKPLRRSLILRWQFARIEITHARVRCALALAAQEGPDAGRWLAAAGKMADLLERESMPWSVALATLARAAIAAQKADLPAAERLLSRALDQLDERSMALYATAARLRRAEMIGGEQGRILAGEARDWMAAQKIVNPDRMAAVMAPGKWSSPQAPGT